MATATAGPALAESLRTQITAAAPDHANVVVESLIEAIKTTKRVKGHCDKCDAWVTVQVQDATAATNAIKVLIEQTEGRPGVAEETERDKVTITRVVGGFDATRALDSLNTGDHDTLRTLLEAALEGRAG